MARVSCDAVYKPISVMYVSQVWEYESDAKLQELFQKITSTVSQEGLKWGETCQLTPVAFGVKKITLSWYASLSLHALPYEIFCLLHSMHERLLYSNAPKISAYALLC